MKRMILLLFVSLPAFAQTTITILNGGTTNGWEDGVNTRFYEDYSSLPSNGEELSGANISVAFTNIEEAGSPVTYDNSAPSATEVATFPNSTMVNFDLVFNGTEYISPNKTYFDIYNAMTGRVTPDYTIYYSNAASFGLPLTYGESSSDTVGGTYYYDGYSGTFSGTMVTSVDAYGTISFAGTGLFTETAAFTRLKSVETLQLSYPGFGVIGTYMQTSYRYYRESDVWPYYKSVRTQINIPIMSINTDTTRKEKAPFYLLSVNDNDRASSILITPNPVVTKAVVLGAEGLLSVTVTDVNGKIVYSGRTNDVDLSTLQGGTYVVRIETARGTFVRKIIKK